MGMDLLDISFRMEKEFGLKLGREFWDEVCIPPQKINARWERGTDIPVWRMLEVICERIGATKTGFETLTRHRNDVYRVLNECFNIAPASIKPETPLDDLIPKDDRRKHWLRLGETLGKKLPEFVRPKAANCLFYCSVAGVIFALTALLANSTKPAAQARNDLALFLLVLSACPAAVWFCIPRKSIPPTCRTVDHLVQTTTTDEAVVVAIKNAAAARASLPPPYIWTDEAVYLVLREVLVNALGIDEEEITLDSKLIQDLGCD